MAIDKASYFKTRFQNIKIHKDGIRFWFDFTLDGKRYSRIWKANPVHSKQDRLKSAYSELERYRDEIKRRDETTELTHNATINDGWELLKRNKQNVWSDAHRYKMENFYNRYIANSLGKRKISLVKSSTLNKFNRSISHLSTRSQKTAYEILTPIFALAIDDELILKSPIKKQHRPIRKASEEKRIITDAVTKYKTIHNTIHRVFKDNAHHRALFLFGFHGRRYTETLSIVWEDIDFENMSYIIRKEHSKVNADMEFALPQDVADALQEFRDYRDKVFHIKKVDKWFAKIREESGIEEFTYHWMRNLSVSALSSMGVSSTHLSAMLGHTDSATIRQYLSLQRKSSTAITNQVAEGLLS